jgi:hypothetical protein
MAFKPDTLILLGVGLWGLWYLGREGNYEHTQRALKGDPPAYTIGDWCGTTFKNKTVEDTPSLAAGEPQPGKIGHMTRTKDIAGWRSAWYRMPTKFGGTRY